jgi:hypothetical protein
MTVSSHDHLLQRLNAWYQEQCDGEWEHHHGVTIESLDNPGWRMRIDLEGTRLEARSFPALRQESPDQASWLDCFKEGETFVAASSPDRLEQALLVFLDWTATAE